MIPSPEGGVWLVYGLCVLSLSLSSPKDRRSERVRRANCQGAGFTILLMILTLGNAAYLFSRFKTYDMQLRSVRLVVYTLKISILT